MNPIKLMLIGPAMIALAACSETVQWEEEVPLNTGEVIWIKRSMTWALQGGYGNPANISMLPTKDESIRFRYDGRDYNYSGGASIRWIAVSPKKQVVLVARAADSSWDLQNNFYCVVPHYVQLIPDAAGTGWHWPERIEPWLYNLSANVMAEFPKLTESRQARYTAIDRNDRDKTYRLQSPTGANIDPKYKSDCLTKFEVDSNKKPEWTKK